MTRKIIHIDDKLCNGCGICIPNCPEGALQLIDGKARLVSDLFCDGLGACIGECPLGAITVEEREAQPYDERRVMAENIIPKGEAVIRAHLEHLQGHGEQELLAEAMESLAEAGIDFALEREASCACGAGHHAESHGPARGAAHPAPQAGHRGAHHAAQPGGGQGCPGSRSREIASGPAAGSREARGQEQTQPVQPQVASELSHWPVQMHLIPPSAPYFRDADLLLAADCVGFAYGGFHPELLRGKRLAIACPKLDSQQDVYLDKLKALIDFAGIRSLTVATMEVPCCRGLLQLARRAAAEAERKVPLEWVEVAVDGKILQRAVLQ